MPDDIEQPTRRDLFVALVGSKPLVVYVDDWVPGQFAFVFVDDAQVFVDDAPVVVVV